MKHMKRLCLFLCLTLFSGLIHATSINIGGHAEHTQVQKMQMHDCHTSDDHTSVSNNTTQCHTEHYQCCLALVIAPSAFGTIVPVVADSFLSSPAAWTLGLRTHVIYKPPKYAS
jgi:hypothetical protein